MSAARAWVLPLGSCAPLLALATVGCTAPSPPSSGGCSAAPISADVSTVRPGDQVVLSADYAAYAACFDHFVNGVPQTPPDPGGVYRDVEIVWAQDGKETVLPTP